MTTRIFKASREDIVPTKAPGLCGDVNIFHCKTQAAAKK
jgi:hypothetical protein